MLRPPAIKNAESLGALPPRRRPSSTTSTVPYPLTQFVKENSNGVLAAVVLEYQSGIAWGRDAAEQVTPRSCRATGSSELGYGAAHGRVLSEGIDTRAARRRSSSSATRSGETGSAPIRMSSAAPSYIDRKPVTIAGVAAAALPGLDFNVARHVPADRRSANTSIPQSTLLRSWNDEAVDMYGRLAPTACPPPRRAKRCGRPCRRPAAEHAGRQ